VGVGVGVFFSFVHNSCFINVAGKEIDISDPQVLGDTFPVEEMKAMAVDSEAVVEADPDTEEFHEMGKRRRHRGKPSKRQK
jgi:hypothetical protein